MPTSRLTRIDRLNQLTHVEPCGSMKEVLGKIETWEQAWTKYEEDNSVTLDIDLKTGALLKMLPGKQEEAIKLRYIEDENKLTYPVLRRQVELWLEAVSQGPVPMDISSLEPSDIAKMSEEQLEQALDILRQGKSGKDAGRGRPPSDSDINKRIKGKCWNCGKEGHTAQDCRQPKKPKGKGKKGRSKGVNSCDEDDDDEEDDEDREMGMLGLSCLDFCQCCEDEDESDDVRVRGEWVPANPKDIELCMFEGVDVSDSEVEDDDEEADDGRRDELTEAIEKQLASRRAIEKDIAKEEIDESDEWKVPKKVVKMKSAEIRGIPLLEAYQNPFTNLVDKAVEVESGSESILDRHLRRIEEAMSTSATPAPSSSPSSVSPCTISSISPIRTTSHKAQEAEQHRLDASVELSPGLDGVTIKIDGIGSEPVYIMGKS